MTFGILNVKLYFRIPDPLEVGVWDFDRFYIFKVYLEDASPYEPIYYYQVQKSSISPNISILKITMPDGARLVFFINIPYDEMIEIVDKYVKSLMKHCKIFKLYNLKTKLPHAEFSETTAPNLYNCVDDLISRSGDFEKASDVIINFLISRVIEKIPGRLVSVLLYSEFKNIDDEYISNTEYSHIHTYPFRPQKILAYILRHPRVPETEVSVSPLWGTPIKPVFQIYFKPNLESFRYSREIPLRIAERFLREVLDMPDVIGLLSQYTHTVPISYLANLIENTHNLRVSPKLAFQYLNTLYHLHAYYD